MLKRWLLRKVTGAVIPKGIYSFMYTILQASHNVSEADWAPDETIFITFRTARIPVHLIDNLATSTAF